MNETNIKKGQGDLRIKRFQKISKLIEDGNAGINQKGRVVDIRKYPGAGKIHATSPQAKQIIFLSAILD
mgnify:CR=1 FL=1